MSLDLARRRSILPRLHDESQDCQANGMAERAQLFSVSVEFGRHVLLLTNSNDSARTISSIIETISERSALSGISRRFAASTGCHARLWDMATSTEELSRTILDYWFSSLDDATSVDREVEPFRTCFARWYGKQASIDAEIRKRFEPVLLAATGDGRRWDEELNRWQSAPLGLLALVILLDQFPRNMYRDSARMYAHDDLALSVTTLAIREYEARPLSLVQRMFLYVPLMHVENLTIQQAMVARFESLLTLATERSPHNVGFYEFALQYAVQHRDVVERFGRFPHRNEILGRQSTAAELEFLQRDDSRF